MPGFFRKSLVLLGLLGLANLVVLAPAPYLIRLLAALSLICALPGFALLEALVPATALLAWPEWVALGSGASYAITSLLALLLHYLPGPITMGHTLAAYDLITLVPLALAALRRGKKTQGDQGMGGAHLAPTSQRSDRRWFTRPAFLLLTLLLLAAALRLTWLGYAEFQGDESLAMLSAAQVLEGHKDALLLRSKGPAEVLLPVALWQLLGTINEGSARAPFALAGCLAVLTMYLIGQRWFNAGLLVGALWAVSGFAVGFSRIVQYQTLVVWMSALALWCVYRAWADGEMRLAPLGGLFLGVGLLAHYDVLLAVPAILYLAWSALRSPTQVESSKAESPVHFFIMGGGILVAVLALFYLPFAASPQARLTASYISGSRVGTNLLNNNLDDFFARSTLYNTSYYTIALWTVVLAWMAVQLNRAPRGRFWAPALMVAALATVLAWPAWWQAGQISLAVLPFAAAFVALLLVPSLRPEAKAAILWLGVPALGYLFVVAYPLTHIQTIYPGACLLAGGALVEVWRRLGGASTLPCASTLRCASGTGQVRVRYGSGTGGTGREVRRWVRPFLLLAGVAFFALTLYYVWVAFLQHDPEYIQTYPAHRLALFWTPYEELPREGYFGFPHRAGWKAVGQLYRQGDLTGDYSSNEEPEVTAWYTRWATRGCAPDPEYYFLARDLVDRVEVPEEAIARSYAQIGVVKVMGEERLRLLQRTPVTGQAVMYQEEPLASAFDEDASTAVFAAPPAPQQRTEAIFGGQIMLRGYTLDTRRAKPGGRLALTLYWQAMQPITTSYHVFTHLETDRIWAQSDSVPACWVVPTTAWQPGQVILDPRSLPLPAKIPSGEYPLLVGFYQPEGGLRLDVTDGAGRPFGNSFFLTNVQVR
jgi:hypothetical protein